MASGTKFPAQKGTDVSTKKNRANGLFGTRFFPGQTNVEYLAEFLLVAGSPKTVGSTPLAPGAIFPPATWDGSVPMAYRPSHQVPLKLFSFFSTSKLETRHEAHRWAFEQGLTELRGRVEDATEADADSFVRGLQALLNGFAGVAGGRTWVSQAFLPVSRSLLAREVMWQHTGKNTEARGPEWEAITGRFQINKHNFFARGGEHLYLQLAQLFSRYEDEVLVKLRADRAYEHLRLPGDQLRAEIEAGLRKLLDELEPQLAPLIAFVSGAQEPHAELKDLDDRDAHFGAIPTACLPEALLFAHELRNLLRCEMDALQRIEALQTLCVLQVMRCFCFQAARYLPPDVMLIDGFAGGYAWVVAAADHEDAMRGLAQGGFRHMKQVIDAATRGDAWPDAGKHDPANKDAEDHGFKLFQRLGKGLGMVVPTRGPRPPHMVLPDHVIRMLVPALLGSGKRLREKEFERRMFLHYGFVLGEDRARVAANWVGPGAPVKDKWPSPAWFTEALRAGGFLIPLSDAVSMVSNPY